MFYIDEYILLVEYILISDNYLVLLSVFLK
jgi:hypothetical protein